MEAAGAKVDALDCLALAEQAGSSKAVNIVLMGRLSHYFDLPAEAWDAALEAVVPPKLDTKIPSTIPYNDARRIAKIVGKTYLNNFPSVKFCVRAFVSSFIFYLTLFRVLYCHFYFLTLLVHVGTV